MIKMTSMIMKRVILVGNQELDSSVGAVRTP